MCTMGNGQRERERVKEVHYISSAEKSSQAHGKFSREWEISAYSNTKLLISASSNEVSYGLIALRILVLPFKAKLGSSSIRNDVFDSNSSALWLTPCRMNTWHSGTFLTMSPAICTLFCIEPVTSMAMDGDSSWSNWLWSTANSSITLPSARRTPATEVRKAQRRGWKYSASFKRRSSPLKIRQCLVRSRRISPCNNGTKPWARRYSSRWNRGIEVVSFSSNPSEIRKSNGETPTTGIRARRQASNRHWWRRPNDRRVSQTPQRHSS